MTAMLLAGRRGAKLAPLLCAGLMLGLMLAASPARADLKLCNMTPSRIGIAIGYQDKKGWTSEGWWTIAGQRCETLLRGKLSGRYYYLHAIDYDRGGSWTGESKLCVQDQAFTLRGLGDCEKREARTTGFLEVDIGNAPDWTIRLTDPPTAPPKE